MTDTAEASEHQVQPHISRAGPLVTIGALVIVVAGIRSFSGQLAPLALGFIIVVAVAPLQGRIRQLGGSAGLALAASIATALGVLVAFILSLIWSAYSIADLITDPEYQDALAKTQDSVNEILRNLGVKEGAINSAISDLDMGRVMNGVVGALSGVAGVVGAIVAVGLSMTFFLTDAPAFEQAVKDLADERPTVTEGLRMFTERTRSYLMVSTVFGLIVALLDGIALWMMGVPLVGVWIVLSFVTNYIPNVGFIIGVAPPAFIALLLKGPGSAIWVIIVYSLLNFVIQTVIQPKFVGDSVGLSTTLTFFSLAFWTYVLGPLGAVLAIPMSLLARALLIDIYPDRQWLRPLISLQPATREAEKKMDKIQQQALDQPDDQASERAGDAPEP